MASYKKIADTFTKVGRHFESIRHIELVLEITLASPK